MLGWKRIPCQSRSTAGLDAAIKAIPAFVQPVGQASKIELPTKQSADNLLQASRLGWPFIDVDLTTQHAVLYGDDGTPWEADVALYP